MAKKQKYYITTTIPYANAAAHIGHALELVYADVMARYQTLLGQDVRLLTGTDEHGQKMYKTAREANRDVEEFAAEKSATFLTLADTWDIGNHDFIRTTEPRHVMAAKKFWEASLASGDIYKKEYSGYYCVGCEAFVTEKELVKGECPIHHKKPELIEEENYFFKLSKYQEPLEFFFKENPNFIYPKARQKEMQNILKSGLKDVSISRDKKKLPWGIPVPNDNSQVMYVWFDALTNYISALGWGSKDEKLFKKYWPADVHVLGKDINRFHALLWPAMLMSAGLELPKQLAVHGFLTIDGEKISKSLGNVIDPLEISKRYSVASLRYFLMSEIVFDADGDFSEEKFVTKYNADLANGLGNLANRILTMIEKYTERRVPAVKIVDEDLIDFVEKINKDYNRAMGSWKFHQGLDAVWQLITHLDQMISDKKPWEMYKQGKHNELNDLLYHLLEGLRHIAINIWPIMPEVTEKILDMLNLDIGKEFSIPLEEIQQWVGLEVGSKINEPTALFPRI